MPNSLLIEVVELLYHIDYYVKPRVIINEEGEEEQINDVY